MATVEQLVTALKNADRAGDQQAARQLAAAINQMTGRRSPAPAARPEPTFWGNATEVPKGLAAGALNLLESGVTGASALLSDEAEVDVRSGLSSLIAPAKEALAAKPGYEDTVTRKFSEAAGSFLPFLAAAPFGVAGVAAGTALGVSAGAGEARTRAEQKGAEAGQRGLATALGAGVGATEMLAPFKIFERFDTFRKAVGDDVAMTAVNRLKRIAMGAGEEGAQEAAAQLAQNLISKGVYDPSQGVFTDTGESLGYGAGVGGLAQALLDLALPGKNRATTLENEPAVEQERGGFETEPEDVTPPAQAAFEFGDEPAPSEAAAPAVEEVVEPVVEVDPAQADLPLEDAPAQVLTAADLDALGIPKRAPVRNAVVGKDAAAPEVIAALQKYARNPTVKARNPEVSERVTRFAAQASVPAVEPVAPVEPAQEEAPEFGDAEIEAALARAAAEEKSVEETPVVETPVAPVAEMTEDEFRSEFRGTGANYTTKLRLSIDRAKEELARAEETPQANRTMLGVEIEPLQAEVARLEALLPMAQSLDDSDAYRNSAKAMLSGARQELDVSDLSQSEKLAAVEAARATGSAAEASQSVLDAIDGKQATAPMASAKQMELAKMYSVLAGVRESDAFSAVKTIDDAGLDLEAMPTATAVAAVRYVAKGGDPKTIGANAAAAPKPTTDSLAQAKAEFEARGGKAQQLPPGAARGTPAQRTTGEPMSLDIETPSLDSETATDIAPEYNESFAQKVKAGATPSQLLAHIAADTRVPLMYRTLAKNLERVSGRLQSTTKFAPMEKTPEGKAVYGRHKAHATKPGETTLNSADPHDYVQTYLHEHIHALTNFAINSGSVAGRRITALFEQYKAMSGDSGSYGFDTAHEFVAEALSNADFQAELKRINMPNTNASMWQRLVEYIKAALGIQTPTKVLDDLLTLTRDAAVSRDADVSSYITQQLAKMAKAMQDANDPIAAQEFLATQGTVYTAMQNPVGSPKLNTSVSTVWKRVAGSRVGGATSRAARKVIAWGLPLPALNDLVQTTYGQKPAYKSFAEAMQKVTETFQEAEGATVRFIDAATPLLARMQKWYETASPEQLQYLADVYFGGTLGKVDLTKNISTYRRMPDRLKAYNDLARGPWKKLDNEGKSIYRQMRAVHDRQFRELADVIENQVFSTTLNKNVSTAVRNKFMQQIAAGTGSLEGYAPLMRPKGKYLLRFFERGANEPSFEIFETLNERADRVASLELDPNVIKPTIQQPTSIDKSAFEGTVPGSFLGDMLQLVESAVVTNAQEKNALMESVMGLAVTVSPSKAVLNRMVNRKETPGYKRDALWAFQNAAIGLGARLSGLKYNSQITAAVRGLEDAYKVAGGPDELSTIVEDVQRRGEYAANPAMPDWSNRLKGATYAMTLGFNVSSAVVDMSSLALITGSVLSARYGVAKATKEMFNAAKFVMSMGTTADVETLVTEGLSGQDLQDALKTAKPTVNMSGQAVERRRVLPSVLNIDFSDPNLPQEKRDLQPLVEAIQGSGHSQRHSGFAGTVEIGEQNWLSKTNALMGFMMNSSERIKREIGIVANYNLELARLAQGKPVTPQMREKAAKAALDTSLLTNGGSTAVTGARFQQGAISSVVMMYKRFAALQMYLQAKAFRAAFWGQDAETKSTGKRQLAWMFATSAAFAGARGMPLMGVAAMIYNLFVDDEEGEEDFESAMRRVMGNGLTEGIPNSLFNVNIGPRVELTNLMMRDTNVRDGATMIEYAAAYAGGPAVGTLNRAWRGVQLIQEGEVGRGIEQMLPSSVSNALKAYRFTTEGTTTLRGDPVTGDVTAGGALSQALGFAPADYARAMDFTVQQRGIDRKIAARRTKLYEKLYTAYRLGDSDEMHNVIEEMVEFNTTHAGLPGIAFTGQGIRASLQTRNRNTQEMIMGALPAVSRRREWLQSAEEWGF